MNSVNVAIGGRRCFLFVLVVMLFALPCFAGARCLDRSNHGRFTMKRMLSLLLFLSITIPVRGAVWYVDKDNSSGTEDGRTWETAFTTIQPAIDGAFDDDGGEVWVAEGVYDEERQSVCHRVQVDTGSLFMRRDVHIYGGFAGTETEREARDWQAHPTVIDGSTARGGLPAYHVVVCFGIPERGKTTLDGFTITGGRAEGGADGPGINVLYKGGGMWHGAASPTITHCVFTGNWAYFDGGGIFSLNSAPKITECVFTDNQARIRGGAMAIFLREEARDRIGALQPIIRDCLFSGNAATSSGYSAGGGAMCVEVYYLLRDLSPVISRCTFSENSAREAGGGISITVGSVVVDSCVFVGNYTTSWGIDRDGGGGIVCYLDASTISNCLFIANSSATEGGAIDSTYKTDTRVVNCTFVGNTARNGSTLAAGFYSFVEGVNCIFWDNEPPQIWVSGYSQVDVTYSDVEGGYMGDGNIDADPLFVDTGAGDYRLQEGSPCIDTGGNVPGLTEDFEGDPRPWDAPGVSGGDGSNYDMGADEYIPSGDVNGDGRVDAMDIQLVINAALDLPVEYDCDVDGDGYVTAVDIQLVINAVLRSK